MSTQQDLTIQYGAVTGNAAFFDLSDWTVIRLSGTDCIKFFHNFCTADIKGLAIDTGCEAFLTNVKARVVGHTLVFADSDAEGPVLTLIASPGQASNLVQHLDRYLITEDVTIQDATSETSLAYVVGPAAAATISKLGLDPPKAASNSHRFTSTHDNDVTARCASFLGRTGFFVESNPAKSPALPSTLASIGVVQAAREVFESLRIGSVFPLYGVDLSEEQLAPEVARPWAISYTKGCYLGQEPIARIDALGHVNRELCGVEIETDSVISPGTSVVADGKEIGRITSSCISFDRKCCIALAYLRTSFAQCGTKVAIECPTGQAVATVYRAT